ncbi:hypothetical protein JG688_00002433 [Phytophthora aleatoria]|uniref:PiggyBac transposable element-derived protein domain-containing protein n=1 Tax=Phytophthora aleatoria TaxID=2496075 RepID=A0A8J5J2Z7_9STRA|nr:hypothetical protein JG688_00002433 [Phytophthora aleatoria]
MSVQMRIGFDDPFFPLYVVLIDIERDSTSAQEYAGLYKGESAPSEAVLAIAESPISLFVFFMPKRFWQRVASESNRYHGKMTTQRAAKFQTRQKARRSKDSSVEVPTRKDIRQRLREMKQIEPHELIVALGLVIARMNVSSLEATFVSLDNELRWRNSTRDLVSSCHGTGKNFSSIFCGILTSKHVMVRRFDEIMRSVHFSDKNDANAKNDRAWEIRPIVIALQRGFRKGFVCPAILSFDEGMIPSRSPFDGIRVYMKDKPHKWGTKLFVACCAQTVYCLR